MEVSKVTSPKKHSDNHKNTKSRNKGCSGHPVITDRSACRRSTYRANVIRQATSSKKCAIAFLAKAGILDTSGELTPLYQ